MMKKFFSKMVLLMTGVVMLTACNDDDDNGQPYSYVIANHGVFVVNEGSYFSQINGSMDFLDFTTWEMHRNIFAGANGRSLGGTPNNAIVNNGRMFIAVHDENRVECILCPTQRTLGTIPVMAPRELATDGRYVYVSSYTGKVTKIDAWTLTVVAESEVVGSNLEGIAVRNGHVYVCNAYTPMTVAPYADYENEVLKLNAGTLERERFITVAANPNQLISDGNNLYLASWGDYGSVPATIQKIDADDQVTTLTNGRMMALSGDSLFVVNTTYDANWNEVTTYHVLNLRTNIETNFVQGSEVFSPGTIGVDPRSKEVFITSYSEGEGGYASYTVDGYVCRYSSAGNFIGRYTTGVGPGTLVFF